MTHVALPIVIVAVILVIVGRLSRRTIVAIAGYLVLVLAILVAIATR